MYYLKKNRILILLCLILLGNFLIRFRRIDYPIHNGEIQRDYLVSRHIIKYKEFPLTGYCCIFNRSFMNNIRHAPLYYYLVAPLLIIKDDLLFITVLNVFLQVFAVYMLYALGSLIFDAKSGLLAAFLYSVSFVTVQNSDSMWMPYVVQSFTIASYLLLALYYKSGKPGYALISVIALAVSTQIFNAVFFMVPAYFICLYLISVKLMRKTLLFYSFLLLFLLFIAVFYAPWIYYVLHSTTTSVAFRAVGTSFFVGNVTEFLDKFYKVIATFFYGFQASQQNSIDTLRFLPGISLVLILNYFGQRNNASRKQSLILMTILMVCGFAIVSLFKPRITFFYLSPLYSVYLIILAEIIRLRAKGSIIKKFAQIMILGIVFWELSNNLQIFKSPPVKKNGRQVQEILHSVEKEVVRIRDQERMHDLRFFGLSVFIQSAQSPYWSDMVYWPLLEKDLNTEFLKVEKNVELTYLNRPMYRFLICQDLSFQELSACRDNFEFLNRQYFLTKNIYEDETARVYEYASAATP